MLQPSPESSARITTLIDEAWDMLNQHLYPEKNAYLSTSRHEIVERLEQFLQSEKWQTKINQWAELGVFLLSDETQKPQINCVNILIKRDSAGLPTQVKVFLHSLKRDIGFECDLAGFEQGQEQAKKYNLHYHSDYASINNESDHLEQVLPKSNDATILSLLGAFNLKWNGQLEATYAINLQTKTGLMKITDAAGQVILNNQTKHVYFDPLPPTTATVLHAQRNALPQTEAQDSAPSRNGTDRYDLRITGQKRSYK